MKPSSFTIVSCVHGRPVITEAWAKHIAQNFTGPVVVAGDDPELRERLERQLGNNLIWVPYYNFPLGAKWNRAAERACQLGNDLVILGSDDFPSPNLFQVWEDITLLKYRWACLSSIYFYSIKWKEISQLTSRYGFGTGRMFPRKNFVDLFENQGYAWRPDIQSRLDADLYQALGHPEDDIVLSSDDSTWILAVKGEEQINSYEKIRLAHPTMNTIETPHKSITEFIKWFQSQPGMKPLRHPGTGKLIPRRDVV